MSDFKKKLLINISIIVGIVVLLGVFLYLFRENIEKQSQEISQLKRQRAMYSSAAAQLSQLIRDWETVKDYRSAVSLLVPRKDNLLVISKDMQALAQREGVSLVFSFGEESVALQQEGLGAINFNASLEGPLQRVLEFLEYMESAYYSVRPETAELSAQTGGGSGVKLFMTGSVFYQK